MKKNCCCCMCRYWYCGKCTLNGENKDCLEERCDDFRGFFTGGDY